MCRDLSQYSVFKLDDSGNLDGSAASKEQKNSGSWIKLLRVQDQHAWPLFSYYPKSLNVHCDLECYFVVCK